MPKPTAPEFKAAMGARVMFCGHNGWFIADMIRVGNCVVVRANGPVTPENLNRKEIEKATHHLSDFPGPVFWDQKLGIFVVPHQNVEAMLNARHYDIIDHTLNRAAGGFFCGGGKEMDLLVHYKLMMPAGRKAGVPDPYFRATEKGRIALRKWKAERCDQ